MDVHSIIRLVLVLIVILITIVYVSMKIEHQTNRFSFATYGLNLLKAVLFIQVIAVIAGLAMSMGDDPEFLIYMLVYGTGIGMVGYTGIFLVQWLSVRRGFSFFVQQILEFVVTLFGVSIGTVLSNLALYATQDDVDLIWDFSGLLEIINLIMISGILMGALLVASTRALYNFKLFSEQQVLAQREMDVLRLQEQATSAKLQVLQTRINPHFLYNALNSIASLVHEDPDRAEKMTMSLSRLFRASLNSDTSYCTTVEQEVALVQTYLEIEEIRFGDRLSTSLTVDPKALDQPIPRFLLQPLVENAVKHGVAGQDGDGFVGLEIRKEDDALEIFVKDSGPDFPMQMTGGFGWKSVSDSLDLLYPERHELYLVNGPEKHVHLTLRNEA